MPSPGSTTARGYGAQHQAERARWQAKIDAGHHVDCWRCGQPIEPGQAFDLGHDDYDRSITQGPEHRYRTRWCTGNRRAGALKGARMRWRKPRRDPGPSRDW